MSSQGIAVGQKKGFVVEKRPSDKPANGKPRKSIRPSYTKGRLNKRTKTVREVVREVAGLAPYEKRILDIIKTGGSTAEKRAYRLSKKRLGTHSRALRKREEIKGIYSKMRARTTQ
eukprot:gb/GECG01000634.1/.p1 GENE.gb/GECG01000634.1/~~gb/GECG01000634.1/.p1  ORF type:complete len:116 (+),score=11.96 gb/GECG01000634.1/:1-348(+)